MMAAAARALPQTPSATVVLACAAADAPAMPKVLKRLVELHVRVDVCAGVELDARPLRRALARGGARTSYVLCCSRELDGSALEHLYRLAREAGIPSDRVHVIRFERHRPEALANELVQRLAELGLVVDPAAPVPLSSDDVTQPVLILPRGLVGSAIPVVLEDDTDVLPLAPMLAIETPAIAPPSRMRHGGSIAAICAALALLAVVGWLARPRDVAAVATAGFAPLQQERDAAVLGAPATAWPAHVAAAIEAGTVHAIDDLIVAEPNTVSMHRVVARRKCKELYHAGLSDWRLPTSAELTAIAAARLLPADTSWWLEDADDTQRARFDGTRLDARSPTPRAAARAVCVHAR